MTSSAFSFLLFAAVLGSSVSIFITEPQDQVVSFDSKATVSFSCRADAAKPVYSWRKNNEPLDTSDASKYTLYGGTLDILKPSESDEGDYQCVAKSDDGIIVSNYGTLKFAYIHDFPSDNIPAMNSYVGTGVAIPCKGADYQPKNQVSFFWNIYDKTEIIKPPGNGTHYVSPISGTLYISNLKPFDQDTYICNIQSRWDGTKVLKTSQQTDLTVGASEEKNAPEFLLSPNPHVTSILGGYVFLECYASGNPTPDIVWTKNGDALPEGAIVTPAQQLILQNVTKDLIGTYTCTASNSESSIQAESTITLDYKPQWIDEIESIDVDLSSTAVLNCKATAVPSATYTWLKDGKVLSSSESGRIEISNVNEGSKLEITEVSKDDQGMYQCIASNSNGNLFSSAKLTVFSKPPSFVVAVPDKTESFRGEDAEITCIVSAAPRATITWEKDDQLLSVDGHKYTMKSEGSLRIRNVSNDDSGMYKSTAENDINSAESQGYLIVFDPTVITKEPESRTLYSGDAGEVVCAAIHDEQLELQWNWKQNGNMVVLGDHYIVQGPTLLLKDVTSKQTGVYECCANTRVGKSCASAQISVVAPPNAPTNIRVPGATATSQRLQWDEPLSNGADIIEYLLEGKNEYDDEWVTMDTVPPIINATWCNVNNLLPYNRYSYRIAARNFLGKGELSEESAAFLTSSASPLLAPTQLGGGGGVPGQLVITWEPIPQQYYGEEDISYYIEAKKSVMQAPVHPIINLTHSSNEDDQNVAWMGLHAEVQGGKMNKHVFTVDSSQIFVPYEVRVQAMNSVGKGPYSRQKIVYTAELAPSAAPTGVSILKVYAYSAEIIWNPLMNENGNARGYNVSVCNILDNCNDPTTLRNFTTVDHQPKITINNLRADAAYKLRLAGYNLGGFGPWWASSWESKDIFHFTTTGPPPNIAPSGVHISIKDLTLSARWEAVEAERRDMPVEGYRVEYWLANKTEHEAMYRISFDTSKTFTIPAGADYYVWVRAFNKGGPGRPSAPVLVSTQLATSAEYGGGDVGCVVQSSVSLMFSSLILWLLVHQLQ